MNPLIKQSFYFLFCGIVLSLTFIIIYNSLPYLQQHSQHNLLAAKGQLSESLIWLTLFYVHIITSPICMLLGLAQFSNYIRTKNLNAHRISGKAYVILSLLLASPTAFILSFFATGGIWIGIPFFISSVLWFYSTLNGYLSIRNKQVERHTEWMIRSYANAASALSFRLYFVLLKVFFPDDPVQNTIIAQWLGMFGNIVAAEIIIQFRKRRIFN